MSGERELVADALAQSFRDAIEASSGKSFADSGVTLPAREIWLRYADAALSASRAEVVGLREALAVSLDELKRQSMDLRHDDATRRGYMFAAGLLERIAALAGVKPVGAGVETLPCDVQLPGVLLRRGVALSTLMLALKRRADWPETDTNLAALSKSGEKP